MNLTPWLWNELRNLFDTDDGSLPEIRVDYRDSAATVAGYALLRGRAAGVVSDKAYFWSKTHDAEVSLDFVSNAAALVASGEAEAFHVVLGGIQSRGIAVPDLGVFVFPGQLALDYRIGPAWGSNELEAFFSLLGELVSLDPAATLSLEKGVLPDVVARFQNAWRRWSTEHAT
ncbi:hypothetical protein [Salinisphaera sp. Q1T1-3]|uniref:hypothetical protein n=1 Tax=Salinisphaera sp. Q1T1-3 TaxID=2321229 RepID=UPI000E713458|nr:hypothetical protein [Salinisphaera sp. Q1T1-3]RJS92033.1 hypothetical protein D3260_12865 [Salinisphaera sp. Q1T1-3]